MGRGDIENGSEELDNLLLYLGLQLSHVQILNMKGGLTTPDIECLHVSLISRSYFCLHLISNISIPLNWSIAQLQKY